ncbi:hypothetical protein Nepgr_021553 [Nepenthes gracilis]|uniref:PGG domain-containing protein n=1 Tax=Nepenthes gracilis TaxID=150966 RepID=A0AAD3T084_NEPGR|nr:hypothetical protein Nepgr_021553 [Nepenthes gracilis]
MSEETYDVGPQFVNNERDAEKTKFGNCSNASDTTRTAAVNPPGGVWQDGHDAGRAIYAAHKIPFTVFLLCNTMALPASVFVISALTYRSRYCAEIGSATASMIFTYGSAIFAVTSSKSEFRYLLTAASVPIGVRILIEMARERSASPNLQISFLLAEIWIATACMIATSGSAIFAVTPRESVKCRYLLAAAGVPYGVPFLIGVVRKRSARSEVMAPGNC